MTTRQKMPLTARLEERFAAPLRHAAFARRTWFSVTLAAIVCVHLALLAVLLWRDDHDPTLLAKAEETAVEVVVEPPPPQPAPPQAAAKPMVEKPATSAPRAPNEETTERAADDKDTHAPKSPTVAAAPPPPSATSSEPAKTEEAKAEPAPDQAEPPKPEPPKPEPVEKDAEALDKAPPEPPKKPAAFAKAKPPPKPVKAKEAKTALQQLAGASDLPDYSFAKPMRKRAKVTGGTEDDRYLAVVFGLIMQNQRRIVLPSGEDWFVTVTFQVDGGGNLIALALQHSSGYREIDAAAIESVRNAGPFPPPPSGTTTGLIARLHSPGDPRAAQLGD